MNLEIAFASAALVLATIALAYAMEAHRIAKQIKKDMRNDR